MKARVLVLPLLIVALFPLALADMEPIPGYETTKQTITAGSGPVVAKGDTVTVHATGIVEEGNKKFWSTKDPGQQPFTYQAGVGKVIIVQAEADLVIADGRVLRDAASRTDEYRVYEVAGAAHIPDIPANHDNPLWGPQIPGTNPVDWPIVIMGERPLVS